ncbi:MAG: methyltransferase domain-containing protein [Mariprofundales bacterium]
MRLVTQSSRTTIEKSWQRIRPLLEAAANSDTQSWLAKYVGNMAEMDDYVAGSCDRFAMILDQFKPHLAAGARILDAGAGYGIQPAACNSLGWEAHASDLYEQLSLYDTLNIPYHRWHLEIDPAPFDDHHFDAVVLSQTIEHFTYSPKHAIQELIRILRPGGYLLIDAPNISSFHNISRLIRGKSVHWDMKKHYLQQEPQWEHGIPFYDRHNHEYAMQDLIDIGKYFGLKTISCGYYSPLNHNKHPLTLAFAHLRDLIPHWRKGLFMLYQTPEQPVPPSQ